MSLQDRKLIFCNSTEFQHTNDELYKRQQKDSSIDNEHQKNKILRNKVTEVKELYTGKIINTDKLIKIQTN